jgi:hypothetical protein
MGGDEEVPVIGSSASRRTTAAASNRSSRTTVAPARSADVAARSPAECDSGEQTRNGRPGSGDHRSRSSAAQSPASSSERIPLHTPLRRPRGPGRVHHRTAQRHVGEVGRAGLLQRDRSRVLDDQRRPRVVADPIQLLARQLRPDHNRDHARAQRAQRQRQRGRVVRGRQEDPVLPADAVGGEPPGRPPGRALEVLSLDPEWLRHQEQSIRTRAGTPRGPDGPAERRVFDPRVPATARRPASPRGSLRRPPTAVR